MRDWYTDERIVDTLLEAEGLGITTCLARCDDHFERVLGQYWAVGGGMNWIAQTDSQKDAVVDNCILNGAEEKVSTFAGAVQDLGLPVSIAGHLPQDFVWAEANRMLDFYMACYYDPSPREKSPHHDEKGAEIYLESDREARAGTIRQLFKPVIHHKIFAASCNDPEAAYAAIKMRLGDAVCIGVFTKDDPQMIRADVVLFSKDLKP